MTNKFNMKNQKENAYVTTLTSQNPLKTNKKNIPGFWSESQGEVSIKTKRNQLLLVNNDVILIKIFQNLFIYKRYCYVIILLLYSKEDS